VTRSVERKVRVHGTRKSLDTKLNIQILSHRQ
jgi:hypothetical protein